jgi:transcriptional regulator with XRE-family HTH domain
MRRNKLGISQEKLAELTGLSIQTINGIEGCRTWVSDKTLIVLADALGVEVFQLLMPGAERAVQSRDRLFSGLLRMLKQDIETDLDARFARFIK